MTTTSVIIPAFNAERFIREALESVFIQRLDGLEVFLVDDGSTDRTASVATECRADIRVINQRNSGAGQARNTGVSAATGEFLAFLDADDVWTDGSLAVRMHALEEHPELDGVFGLVENWPEREGRALGVKAGAIASGQVAGTMLIRRASFLKAGMFAEVRLGEFIEWYARATDAGLRFETVQQVVLRRRIHAGSTTATAESRTAYLKAMQSIIARRRAAGP